MNGVTQITQSNITPAGNLAGELAQGTVYVLFYANWCGHCINMKPRFTTKAREGMYRNNSGHISYRYRLAMVDCTDRSNTTLQNRMASGRFQLNYFPYVVKYVNGQYVSTMGTGTSLDSFIR